MDKFTDIINNLTERNIIIITGDFNAKHTSWFNDHNNKVGEKLNDFTNASVFIILNDEAPTIQELNNRSYYYQRMHKPSKHNVIKFVVGLRDVLVKKKISIWRVNKADWSE